jgi:hypothetical protein
MVVGVGTRIVAERQPIALTTDGGRPLTIETPGFNPA